MKKAIKLLLNYRNKFELDRDSIHDLELFMNKNRELLSKLNKSEVSMEEMYLIIDKIKKKEEYYFRANVKNEAIFEAIQDLVEQ